MASPRLHVLLTATVLSLSSMFSGCNDIADNNPTPDADGADTSDIAGGGSSDPSDDSGPAANASSGQFFYALDFASDQRALVYEPPSVRDPIEPLVKGGSNVQAVSPEQGKTYALTGTGLTRFQLDLQAGRYDLALDGVVVPSDFDLADVDIDVSVQLFDPETGTFSGDGIGWEVFGLREGLYIDKVLLEQDTKVLLTVETFVADDMVSGSFNENSVAFDLILERIGIAETSSDWNGLWRQTPTVDRLDCNTDDLNVKRLEMPAVIDMRVEGDDLFIMDERDDWTWTAITVTNGKLIHKVTEEIRDQELQITVATDVELSLNNSGDEYNGVVTFVSRDDAEPLDCELTVTLTGKKLAEHRVLDGMSLLGDLPGRASRFGFSAGSAASGSGSSYGQQ